MATITPQQVALTGLAPSFAAASGGGDEISNSDDCFFVVKNGGGGAITVTFDDTGTVSPAGATAFNPDVVVSVPAGAERYIGPFPRNRFGQLVPVSYSGVTSVTVAAVVV